MFSIWLKVKTLFGAALSFDALFLLCKLDFIGRMRIFWSQDRRIYCIYIL